jgi:hypothetical protein
MRTSELCNVMIIKRQPYHIMSINRIRGGCNELCSAYREAYDRRHDTPGRWVLALPDR